MRRKLRIAAVITLVLLIGAGGYLYYMYHSVQSTISAIYEPIDLGTSPTTNGEVSKQDLNEAVVDPSKVAAFEHAGVVLEESTPAEPNVTREVTAIDFQKKEPFTLLLLGVDERKNDKGRSDTIVVLGVNPAKQSALMFNIPRDTRTEIVGKGKMDKINHAYAFGGIQMAVQTVENFLNIPINYYVKVNMEGFENIVNILGGVEVNNAFEFTYEGVTYPKGKVSLDGHNALMYSRMRYDDPKGDIGRNARQQSILANLFQRTKRVSTVMKWSDILDEVKENARTNLTMDDMTDIFNHYRNEIDTIDKEGIHGTNGYVNHIYYYLVSEKERARMHQLLMKHLES